MNSMTPRRLNLDSIRKDLAPRGPVFDTGFLQLISSGKAVRFSRRGLFGLAGSAIPLAARQGPSKLEIRRSPGRLALFVDGRECWEIDAARFSGTPDLSWTEDDRRFEFSLTGAAFPGTNVPAGLSCVLTEAAAGWMMDLSLEFCSFQVCLPLIPWLVGEQPAYSSLKLSSAWKLGGKAGLRLRGPALAEFRPDWTLRLAGDRIARLSCPPLGVQADRAVFSLPTSEPSLLEAPASRRTFVSLEAGEQEWALPVATAAEEWKLDLLAGSFGRMLVETDDGENGVALLASASHPQATGAFTPSPDLTTDDGTPLQVPLRNPRYAFHPEAAKNTAAFVADMALEPTWAFGHSFHMELAAGPETPPLEIATVGSSLSHVLFAPQVRQMQAPVEGAVSSCSTARAGECELPATEHSSYDWWRVLFWPPNWGHRLRELPLDPLNLRVVRPQDFLLLE